MNDFNESLPSENTHEAPQPELDIEHNEILQQQEHLEALNREHAAVANPEITMKQLTDQSKALNSQLEEEIKVLSTSINEHEIGEIF